LRINILIFGSRTAIASKEVLDNGEKSSINNSGSDPTEFTCGFRFGNETTLEILSEMEFFGVLRTDWKALSDVLSICRLWAGD
jgi:hypothetical protein